MARRSARLVVLPLIALFLTIPTYSQMFSFLAENPTVPPGAPGCVQVGLFLRESGMGTSWSGIVATLDYSADPGVLAGDPFVRLSSFLSMSEPGLTSPATERFPHIGAPTMMCDMMNTTNSVILGGGMSIPYMGGNGAMLMFTEDVNTKSGRINLVASAPTGAVAFSTQSMPMQDELFAILTFPVSGLPGAIHINFANVPGGNALIDTAMMSVAPIAMTNGGLQVDESTIPTLSEWGMIAFLSGVLLSALFLLRRRSVAS